MIARFIAPFCIASLGLIASCETTNWYDYTFAPAPLEIPIRSERDPRVEVRALVTILGIMKGYSGAPDRIEVRMRLENIGGTPARLEPDSFSLVTADLQVFEHPELEPPETPVLQPGDVAAVDVAFALPLGKRPENFNLRGITLDWTMDFNGVRQRSSVPFSRTDWRPYEDSNPHVHFGVGVGYIRG
jgi:hypothetical protein